MNNFRWLILVIVILAGRASADGFSSRIVGGEFVPDNRFAFMAAVFYDRDKDGTFFQGCGGSFIGDRWVLTAAHCVVDVTTKTAIDPSDLAVLLGERNLEGNGGEFISVSGVYPHPAFDLSNYHADVALLELSRNYNGTVLTIPTPNSPIPVVDEVATVAGWGNTAEDGNSSLDLLSVRLPIVSHIACFPFYQNSLDESLKFCAGGAERGGFDACQGDSGGPIFVARDNLLVQAGIVSHGEGCARPGIPGVYTRLTTFSSWITSIATDTQLFENNGNPDIDDANSDFSGVPALALNESEVGSVSVGDVAPYEVTGAAGVELQTISGDADLYLLAGTDIEPEAIICSSEEEGSLDFCSTNNTPGPIYAIVYGFEDAEYSITALGTQPTDPIPVLPATVQSPAAPTGTTPQSNSPSAPVAALNDFSGFGGGGSTGIYMLLLLALFRLRRQVS